MTRLYQTIGIISTLLLSLQNAHAITTAPTADKDFGLLSSGDSKSDGLEIPNLVGADGPRVIWFGFQLGGISDVSMNTNESQATDTVLALYDSAGSVLGQNDDCSPEPSNIFSSCLSFDDLPAGSYLAGVTLWTGSSTPFLANWMTPDLSFDNSDNKNAYADLNIQVGVVPVPAAVWLFGTALIGFVGIARRTTFKS